MNKVKRLWLNFRSSLWFVPVLMVIASAVLALVFIEVDGRTNQELLAHYPRIFGAGADGSRGMLSSIAGSMITVAGLTFSLTIVAMSQASSQYTSRILRNFMRDRSNQFVLGFFVGIFVYCLIVLRTLRGGDELRFIPSLAVLFGLLLAISSVFVLVFFIHHIASSIQASYIISSAAKETIRALKKLFPDEVSEELEKAEAHLSEVLLEDKLWRSLPARETGYLQDFDAQGLVTFALECDCVVRIERGLGSFVVKDSPLVLLGATDTNVAIDEATTERLNELFTIKHYRTIDQDVAFGIRQIVDIALKALSPGVNDTTSAVVCIDYLGAILAEFAGRRIDPHLRSRDGHIKVIARIATFESLVRAAFDQIRDVAADNTAIYLRLLVALETVIQRTTTTRRKAVLAAQVDLISDEADRVLATEYNLKRVRERVDAVRAKLNQTFVASTHSLE